eukprot:g4081.t1
MDMTSTSFNFCINSTLFTEISFNANDLSSMAGFNLAMRDEESTTLVSFPEWIKNSDGVPEYKICVPGGNNGCEVGCGKRDACNYRETTAGHNESMCSYPVADEIPVTLELSDILGDGRIGHGIHFEQTDGSKKKFVIAYKQKTYNFCLPTDSYTQVTVFNDIKQTSQDHNEVRWSLLNRASGVELIGDDYSDGYLYERGTPDITEYCVPIHDTCVIGCSDEDACNYDPDASKITSNERRQNCSLGDYAYYIPMALELNDRYGDGWQGHSIVFEQDDGSTNTYTIEEQEWSNSSDPIQKTYNFCLDLASYTKVTVHKGSDSQEVHWSLMSRLDNYRLIGDDYSDGFFDGEDAPSEIEYCVQMGVVKTCVIGCADENACDYDPEASNITSNLWRQNCAPPCEVGCGKREACNYQETIDLIHNESMCLYPGDNEIPVALELNDRYGDGWQNHSIAFEQEDGSTNMYTIEKQDPPPTSADPIQKTYNFCLHLNSYTKVTVHKGLDSQEVHWSLLNRSSGEELIGDDYSDRFFDGEDAPSNIEYCVPINDTCEIGCADENACDYDPDASKITSNLWRQNCEFQLECALQSSLLWSEQGSKIEGSSDNERLGVDVSLSSDGTRITVSGGTTNKGYVRMYEYDEEWTLMNANQSLSVFLDAVPAVSLSRNGDHVAVGNRFASSKFGTVTVYKYHDGIWGQIGQTLEGNTLWPTKWKGKGQFGNSVALSQNGIRMVVGAPMYKNKVSNVKGFASVFNYNSETQQWVQIGETIEGMGNSKFGTSVSISSNGDVIAISGPGARDPKTRKGYVGVYQYNQTESEWVRMGPFIENVNADETKPDQFGMKVSLSATGTRVAVGAPKNKGFVYVFDYDSSHDTWVQVGTRLTGKKKGDLFGTSVSLSDDGLRLAVGAKKYDEPKDSSGQVRMYIFDGTDWVQIGMDVNGEKLKDQFGTSKNK